MYKGSLKLKPTPYLYNCRSKPTLIHFIELGRRQKDMRRLIFKPKFQGRQVKYQKGRNIPEPRPTDFQISTASLMVKLYWAICLHLFETAEVVYNL